MDNEMMDDSVWGAVEYWHGRITEALERAKDKVAMEAAYRLPRRVVKWAFVRATAEASTGSLASMETPAITALQVLRAWENPDEENPCEGCHGCDLGFEPARRVIVFAGFGGDPEEVEVPS